MRKLLFLFALAFSFLALSFTVEAQFSPILNFGGSGSPQGLNPYGSIILSTTGDSLFGMTAYGGFYGLGNIFCISSSGYDDLLDFDDENGAEPFGSLTLSGNLLYGMTAYAGPGGNGNIFSIAEDGSNYTELYQFSGTDGSSPYGSLISSVTGDTLYGMTSGGGTSSFGSLFCITTTGAFTTLLNFNNTNGAYPNGSLTLVKNHLYGMTSQGGTYNYGTIFAINTNTFSHNVLYNFDGTNGSYSYGSITPSVTGDTLWGMTSGQGALTYGNIFSYIVGTGYADLFDFNGTNGAYPGGDLTLSNGVLYGMTTMGGSYTDGNIFSIHPDGTNYIDLYDFPGPTGAFPYGSITFSQNNHKFFGMTSQGGEDGGDGNDGVVFVYDPLQVDSFQVVGVTCTNRYQGSAAAIIMGGNPPYTYSWNPGGSTDDTITGLSVGSYTVTVTDNLGSTATSVAIVSGLSLAITGMTHESCYGDSSGSVTTSPSGGTAPYVYVWGGIVASYSSGGGSASIGGTPTDNGLTAGTYTITVKDACGDTAFVIATITQPPLLSVRDTVLANVHCSGDSTGIISAIATGGVSPYTYLWSDANNQTTASATGLSAGTYSVTVTDNNSCTAMDTTIVGQPVSKPLGATIGRAISVACSGGFDGLALAIASGGLPPYTYLWTPAGGTTSLASGLSAGIYSVQVTDARGCNATVAANITQPALLVLNDTTIASLTYAIPSGGTPPYSYTWAPGGSTSALMSGISAGTYTVTVTDANGCADSALVLVPSGNSILYYLTNPETSCGDPSWVNFDVMVSSNQSTRFNSCFVYIYYTTAEFYGDLVSYSNIVVTPGNDFQYISGENDYSHFWASNSRDTILEIQLGDSTDMSPGGTIISPTPQVLFKVSLQIQDPCQTGEIGFTNTSYAGNKSYYTDSTYNTYTTSYEYSAIIYDNADFVASDFYTGSCPPIIDYSTPIINAGTNAKSIPPNSSILTITGWGFGNQRDSIQVSNANSGPRMVTLDSVDILYWSENLIKVKMPDVLLKYNWGTPGTGPFKVYNACGESTSSSDLTINYNIENSYYGTQKFRDNIIMTNDTVSILWRCDTSIWNNPDAIACVKKAIAKWNCYTGVNWKLSSIPIYKDTTRNDSISVIYFGNNGYFETRNTLMQTKYWPLQDCSGPLGDSVGFYNEADIKIKRNRYMARPWSYDMTFTQTSTDSNYFYDDVLHELGHAHGLNHINDTLSLMNWYHKAGRRDSIPGGVPPGPQTLYGAFDMINTSISYPPYCGNDSILLNTSTHCIDPSLSVPMISQYLYNLNLFPNPSNGGIITIVYELPKDSYIQFKIVDCTGRVVKNLDYTYKTAGNYSEQINVSNLAKAIYLFTANINGECKTIKFVKL